MNFPMTTGGLRADNPFGLISGHAYTFLDVAKLKDEAGNVVHVLAKLRNPWNMERYKGPFRDNDDVWREHPEWAE